MPRGGANGGPQYNPANISLTGGAGTNGSQAPKYIAGMGYGQGQALLQQQQGAKMAGPTPAPAFKGSGAGAGAGEGQIPMGMPLTAPSAFPDEKITTGAAIDDTTAGPESLMMPQQGEVVNDPDLDLVREYFPVIEMWASQIDTSQGTKDYVNYLRTII